MRVCFFKDLFLKSFRLLELAKTMDSGLKPSCAAYFADTIMFNTLAREWRCKWSDDSDKKSLVLCQKALEEMAIPELRFLNGLSGVQRVVCGGNKDFKVIVKLSLDAFEDWKQTGFHPEPSFLAALMDIEGVTEVEAQTYTIMPVFGKSK